MESVFHECLLSEWISEWPDDDRKHQFPGSLGSATDMSCHPRQVLELIKSAEWVKKNDCFWLPCGYVARTNETVRAQRLQCLWRRGLMSFPVMCSRFKIPARLWHGIFRRDWSQRNNVVLRRRFLSGFYELPLAGCGPLREFATICANVKTCFPPFAEWALSQFTAKF